MVLNQIGEKGTRFNKLKNGLNAMGAEYKNPTLLDHLRHLEGKGLVIRREVGFQNVNYSVNYDKLKESKKFLDRFTEWIKMYKEDKSYLFSLEIDEQIVETLRINSLRKLHELKTRVNSELDKKNFAKGMELFIWLNPIWERRMNWVVGKCLKDNAYREEVMKKIDEFIKKLSGQTQFS